MRQLSLHRIYGCSTTHRNSIIALPENRVAFLAGSYLVVMDCLTNEQRYLSFSAIESLYISSSGLLMGIIDRFTQNGDTRIHLYSTKPIDLLFIIEPDRLGSFIGISINKNDNLLMILHSEPTFIITIQEIKFENDERQKFNVNNLASVRAVHGSVFNRMIKKEIIPHVSFVSFCPYVENLFCATGAALFQYYEIENQIINKKFVHFRAEFYIFTCHCWLDINSILAATDHGHLFWIHDGSIRSDINLQESITIDLKFKKTDESNESSRQQSIELSSSSKIKSIENNSTEMFKDNTQTDNTNLPMTDEKQLKTHTNSSSKNDKTSEETILYLDVFTSTEILPYFIVSFREYILVFTPIDVEPFFQIIQSYCLKKSKDNQIDLETHNIHKMSYIFDNNVSLLYVLTDRNQIFRYTINQLNTKIELEEKLVYGWHAYNVLSIGLCTHKSWLITLGGDNLIKILDYKDNDREIVSKSIQDSAYVATGSDPYGFHLCVAMNNCFRLYLITNYELRMTHQYETRNIRDLEMSQSGHLVAVITNNLIKIYSTIHFNLISQLRGHVGKIRQVSWCNHDSILISCGTDGIIYIFNIFTGMREGEIITKQYRYMGIAVTNDGTWIYAITVDSSIKVFNNTSLHQEWSIENGYIPSSICLSNSERLLYVGMTHGIIRVYTIPLIPDGYIDLPAHNSSIRRLLVSYDDQYLVSIAESAYVLLFKQTINNIDSTSSQYKLSKLYVENIDTANEPVQEQTVFEYILVTKSEFDEKKRKIQEIQTKINEFEAENNLKLNSQQISFSQRLTNYSNQCEAMIKRLNHTYEELQADIANDNCNFLNQQSEIEENHTKLKNHIETIYENKMIETLSHIQTMQSQLEKLQTEYKTEVTDSHNQEQTNLIEIIDKMNEIIQSEWHSAVQNHEEIKEQEREMNEYIRQVEIDIDDEIENMKIYYENELEVLNEYSKRLTLTVNTLRKRYNAVIERLESRDIKRNEIEKEVKELYNRRSELTEKLDRFRLIIKKKEDRIGASDIKLHSLQQQILHVEKRKYVLDYKTKSLIEHVEPVDQEILRLKRNNENLEQRLTILKKQQNDLILRENEYEVKLRESSKRLYFAKNSHRSSWKIVQQQKEAIKKAYEYLEIHCTLDETSSNQTSKDQLKIFIQNMCFTMQNEKQTENQLEIQGFMNEWNNQRKWLLNQLNDLTNYTEENKQSFSNTQREHRKAIAPFINQLRELHNLFDDVQKKIQKRLLLLKIKTSEQTEFLQNISDILHGNEKMHLTIDQIHQNELLIEIQDKEMDRLNLITFRYQYPTPCLEFNETEEEEE